MIRAYARKVFYQRRKGMMIDESARKAEIGSYDIIG